MLHVYIPVEGVNEDGHDHLPGSRDDVLVGAPHGLGRPLRPGHQLQHNRVESSPFAGLLPFEKFAVATVAAQVRIVDFILSQHTRRRNEQRGHGGAVRRGARNGGTFSTRLTKKCTVFQDSTMRVCPRVFDLTVRLPEYRLQRQVVESWLLDCCRAVWQWILYEFPRQQAQSTNTVKQKKQVRKNEKITTSRA